MREKIFDSWEVDLVFGNSKKYKGKLTVTEQRLIFDYANDPVKRSGANHPDHVRICDDEYIILNRSQINTIIIAKGIFERKVTIRLKNNNEYVFECSMSNIEAISKAVSLK